MMRRFGWGLGSWLALWAAQGRGAEIEPKPQYQCDTITIAAASADEPLATTVSMEKAVAYLDDGAKAWSAARQCVSCHTNGIYLTVRPALTSRLGPPDPSIREFFVSTLAAKQQIPLDKLAKGTTPEQLIYLAAGLADWDRYVTKKRSPETDAALRLMLSVQRDDGTWNAKDCWPPYESDSYHPATVAIMAIAGAPGWLETLADPELQTRVDRLKTYLQTAEPPHDYARVLLLWSAARLPGLIERAQQQALLATLRHHQQEDGGWSIRTFAKPEQWGSGNRAQKLRDEADFANPASDGHMTGLALVVLAEHGAANNDPAVVKGLAWLERNQRVSGRWWTRSLNTDNFHFVTYSGTAFPVLALSMFDRWPTQPSNVKLGLSFEQRH